MARWFVKSGEKSIGPLTAEKLRALASQGKIKPTTKIRTEDSEEWIVAGSIKGLLGQTSQDVKSTEAEHPATAPSSSEERRYTRTSMTGGCGIGCLTAIVCLGIGVEVNKATDSDLAMMLGIGGGLVCMAIFPFAVKIDYRKTRAEHVRELIVTHYLLGFRVSQKHHPLNDESMLDVSGKDKLGTHGPFRVELTGGVGKPVQLYQSIQSRDECVEFASTLARELRLPLMKVRSTIRTKIKEAKAKHSLELSTVRLDLKEVEGTEYLSVIRSDSNAKNADYYPIANTKKLLAVPYHIHNPTVLEFHKTPTVNMPGLFGLNVGNNNDPLAGSVEFATDSELREAIGFLTGHYPINIQWKELD